MRQQSDFRIAIIFLIIQVTPIAVSADEINSKVWHAIEKSDFSGAKKILGESLAINPNDVESLFLLARVLRWNSELDQSLSLTNELVNRFPLNADYLLLKAQVLNQQSKLNESLEILDQARSVSPSYQEIWDLELEILEKKYTSESRAKHTALAKEYRLRFPTSAKLYSLSKTNSKILYRATLAYQQEWLSNKTPNWSQLTTDIGGSYRHYRLSFMHDLVRRYGVEDKTISASFTTKPDDAFTTTLEISKSVYHIYLPKWSLRGYTDITLSSSWLINTQVRYLTYQTSDVTGLGIGPTYLSKNWRISYQLKGDVVNSKYLSNVHAINISATSLAHTEIGTSIAIGRDFEVDVAQNVRSYEIFSTRIYASILVNDRYYFIVDWLHHQQDSLYERSGFRIGTSINY